MVMLSKSGISAAVTQITWLTQAVTITIPAGKGGWLKAIEFQINPVLTTNEEAGGLCKAYNSAADWDPFYFLTASHTAATESGDSVARPVRYAVDKELPGNSSVYVDYMPFNALSQFLQVTLIWELGTLPTKETFSKYIHPLAAAKVESTARASPGNCLIPGGKGGRVIYLVHKVWGLWTTIICGGGLAEVVNNAYDMEPAEWYTTYFSMITNGGGVTYPELIPWDCPAPQNSTFTTYLTPATTQLQSLSTLIVWERPVRRVVSGR